MQEMQHEITKELKREVFIGASQKEILAKMDKRKTDLEREGFKLVKRVKIGRNDPMSVRERRQVQALPHQPPRRAAGAVMMRIEISANAVGNGSVKVDGIELGHVVERIELDINAGRETRVALHLSPLQVQLDATTQAKLIEIHGRAVHEIAAASICKRCGHDKSKGFCPMSPPGSGCPET